MDMRAIAPEFFRRAFEPTDTIAIALINKKTDEAVQRIALVEKIASEPWQKWLRYKNREGFEVYYTINTLTPGARRRDKQDVHDIRHLFLDFDHDGAAALDRLRLRTDIPQPNYIVNTSPGKFQVIWRAAGFTISQSEGLLQALARDTGADIAVTDAPRLLRLPGFYNRKYDPPHFVTLTVLHAERFTVQHFPRFPEIAPAQHQACTAFSPARNTSVTADPSQSGQDWRNTLSRLRRGADPQLVIKQLAESRKDKAKPLDYAQRTVSRALRLIQSTPTGRYRGLL